MARPLTVLVVERQYVVLDSPEALDDGAEAHIDHEQRVVWLRPGLRGVDRERVVTAVVAQAWRERLRGAPVVR